MFMIDSVLMESVNTGRCKISPTPFMDSLRKEGLWTTNLYSHGPYTDAATRSLYTGRNTLDDFGYFFKLNTSPITHYKAFKDNGYETIGFYYPYYMMGDNVTRYIDKLYYKAGFEFGSEWGGIFSYYYEIRKQRMLNADESFMLKKRLDLMFEVWCAFYDKIVNEPDKVRNMVDIFPFSNIERGKASIEKERDKYEKNKDAYVEDFLQKGLEHNLNKINDISIDNRINRDYLNETRNKFPYFYKTLERNNILANLFSTMPSPKRIYKSFARFLKTKDKSELEIWSNYFGGLFFYKQVYSRWGEKRWQNMPSTQFQLDFVEKEILPNRSKEKPFFLCLNIEEAHNNLSFFTYDIKDEDLIAEEIKVLNEFLKQLGTNFKGNIIYYLGLRYMDYCIEKFCSHLKKEGLWNNTTILFTADHGSSYSFYPVHTSRVNNFHDECYHIPVLIRQPGFAPKEITSFQYSKDIIPTLMDMLGLELSPYFKGTSMIRDVSPRKCIVNEYMGPGCPDILQRPVWFSARDHKYLIAYKVALNGKFSDGKLCEIYDRVNDKKEYYNIVDKIDRIKVQYLLDEIEARFNELKSDTISYYQSLKKTKSGIPLNL